MTPRPQIPPRKPSRVRRVLVTTVIGTVVGFTLACLFGPQLISLWYRPPSQDAFNCGGSVQEALGAFVKLELICAGVGGLGFAILVLLLSRGNSKPAPSTTTPTV